MARPARAGGDLRRSIAALIKPQLGDPRPDRRGRDDPAGALAGRARGRRPTATRRRAGREPRRAASTVPRWERRTDQPIRILTTGLAGFLTAVVLCFPFGLSVIEPGPNGQLFHSGLIEQVFKTAGGYPYASVNAYNPWALASVDGTGVAANSGWACDTVDPQPGAGRRRRARRR